MTTNDYSPIGCDDHSVLEVLALRRVAAVVDYVDAGGVSRRVAGQVIDVLTHSGAEYLEVRSACGDEHPIRLDHLRAITSPDGALLWRQQSGIFAK